jgi:hypothetical protein
MSARMISLESRHNELDGKFSDLLKKPHANSQALIDIKSMFSKFLGTQKDELSSHLEPKSTCEKKLASLHDASMVPK